MPTRTGYAGTAAEGDVYTAANHARMPGGWLGYAQVTAPQTIVAPSGAVDLTGLSVAVTVGTNRRIRVTGYGLVTTEDGTNIVGLWSGRIMEGATMLGYWAYEFRQFLADSHGAVQQGSVVLTPTAGVHTYKLDLTPGDSDDVILQANPMFPAFILVEDIGPAT